MKRTENHLPIYGVGPYYGASILLLTVLGIVLSAAGVLEKGKISGLLPISAMVILGIFLLIEGFLVWKAAAIGKNSIDDYIKENRLCTTGIYRLVRNPCYSGIMLACTGVILLAHNLWLLILPPIYWLVLTVLMKFTEEKWLADLYGEEYFDYCKRVNRCIPWFPRKIKDKSL